MTKSRTSIQSPTYDQILGDPDLCEIIEDRIRWRFGIMCDLAEKDIQAMASQCRAEDVLKLGMTSFETIIQKELIIFTNEWDRYRQRYGSCYLKDIKAARDGNDRLLKRLLVQDKAWLGRGWVSNRILWAQRMGASDLLWDFGDSIRKQQHDWRCISGSECPLATSLS